MNIRIFNKKYWVRRFGEQRVVRGYLTSGSTDFVVSLNVHPLGTDSIQALPEGERKMRRLEGHGEVELRVADEARNTKGDLLYYRGAWYECVSSQPWDHTLLSHYNYQFVLVPRDGALSIDTDPMNDPVADPSSWKEDANAT